MRLARRWPASPGATKFNTAVTAVVQAYRDVSVIVDVERRYDIFARLMVTEDGRTAEVELGVDWRANDPIVMSVGPVLHPDDAVASKMSALYGRAFARDFIDIDATLCSGRYSGEDLLRLAERADSGFDRRIFANALGQAGLLDPADSPSTASPAKTSTRCGPGSRRGVTTYSPSRRRNSRAAGLRPAVGGHPTSTGCSADWRDEFSKPTPAKRGTSRARRPDLTIVPGTDQACGCPDRARRWTGPRTDADRPGR